MADHLSISMKTNFDPDEYSNTLLRGVETIREKTDFVPEVALVLGSGLGDYADNIEKVCEVPYSELEGFPVPTLIAHAGKLIFGTVDGVRVVCMKGRVHYYEGYAVHQAVMFIRLLGLLGVKKVIITNAAGEIRRDWNIGDFMLIRDHISSFIESPLRGPSMDAFGVRFVDMTKVYDEEMREAARKAAEKLGIVLREGVYVQVSGPQFETPTEIDFYERMGADAVGMSTVIEAIAARQMGIRVCGISCMTNKAAGRNTQPLSDDEVRVIAAERSEYFRDLVTEIVKTI